MSSRSLVAACIVAIFLAAPFAYAQRVMRGAIVRPGAAAGPGMVNLPYFVQDNKGNQWRVYQNGWLQQQGNMPLYSQGAQLTINGNQPSQNNNMGRMDEKTGELVI